MDLLDFAFGICCVAAFAVLLAAFICLDRLIRAAYQTHHETWLADGRPYFMGAPERLGMLSQFAWMRVSWVWLFRSPSWIQSSPECSRRLRWLRRCVIAWNVAVVILALCFAFVLP